MELWLILTLASIVLYGFQNFFYRVAAHEKYDALRMNVFLMMSAALLSFFLYIREPHTPGLLLVVFMLANGMTWFIANLSKIRSYTFVPLNVSFPVSRMYIALTPLLVFLFFGQAMSGRQLTGLAIAVGVVFLISSEGKAWKARRNFVLGVLLAGAAAILSSFNNIISTVATRTFDLPTYLFGTYLVMFFLTLLMSAARGDGARIWKDRESVKLGLAAGVANAVSYALVLYALQTGPAAVIFTIFGLNIVITVGLTMLVYKEKMTLMRAGAMALSLVAVWLLA